MTSASLTAPAQDAAFEAFAAGAMRWSVALIVLVSMGVYHEALVPEKLAFLQQVATLALWGVVIGASLFVRPLLRLEWTPDLAAIALFYAFAVLSVTWSEMSAPNFMKAAAMSITTLGAFRLVTRVDLDDIVGAITFALFLLLSASIVFALFIPSIGLDDTWMHKGQWQGVFASKQALGIIGAHLMLFACYRKLTGGGWLPFLLAFAVAGACVIGSESRGGGALALAACLVLYLCMRSTAMMKLFALAPLVLTGLACLMIGYIYLTGYDSFHVGNARVNFTERTFIWQYAISHFDNAPIFGYGLNGFWTIKPLYDYFEQNHGWVLDNYHDGYIAILIETGLVGFVLFVGSTLLVTARLLIQIAARSMPRPHATIIIGFALLNYQINLTETNFLRSTSFMSILLIMFQVAACAVYGPVARPSRPAS